MTAKQLGQAATARPDLDEIMRLAGLLDWAGAPDEEWDYYPEAGEESVYADWVRLFEPNSMIALVNRIEATEALLVEAREALDGYFHTIDCGKPLFGESRCPRCAAIHDPSCLNAKGPTEVHESRWCDGNPSEITKHRLRALLDTLGKELG